eukprot:gene9599-11369_t
MPICVLHLEYLLPVRRCLMQYSELSPECLDVTLAYCAGTGISESACDEYNNAEVQVATISQGDGGTLTGGSLPTVCEYGNRKARHTGSS